MNFRYLVLAILMVQLFPARAQDSMVKPTTVGTGTLLGISRPLRDIPPLSAAEYEKMVAHAEARLLNPKIRKRGYPFEETALPKGPDGVWQKSQGKNKSAQSGPIVNFEGQSTPIFPPDANGVAGPDHYMQTINTTYAIYSKTGNLLAGPANLNMLFGDVPGAANPDIGDPIVLYDQIAGRWMAVEASSYKGTWRMMVAVSATDDPTGVWYQYSFVVGGLPDYVKLGIWPDGYYMSTNSAKYGDTDTYVLQREVMLAGGDSPKMVAFENPWRPGFPGYIMVTPPVDNDGPAAPTGSPGILIAHQDDVFDGEADQLWMYELDVDWTTTSNSTFTRVQRIDVEPFDSNFNYLSEIIQPGTQVQLEPLSCVMMNAPIYRNFGTHQTIVCCHTVNVDGTDHAGMRWYELRKTDGDWIIRQQGTYAPDEHSRWMGSIAMSENNEIALGYSISSSTVYPGIRYTGQSATEYAKASGIMNIPEEVIWDGTTSQTGWYRWGDYSKMSVDPTDDKTFWYTNQYEGSERHTRIASFVLSNPPPLPEFTASNFLPCLNETVIFADQSTEAPTAWEWNFSPNSVTYVNGTSSSSHNPNVEFNALGAYEVTLAVSNPFGTSTVTESGYIVVNEANAFFSAMPLTLNATDPVIFTDESTCDVTSWSWTFGDDAMPAVANGSGPHTVVYSTPGKKSISLTVNGGSTMTRTDYVTVLPHVLNMENSTVSLCVGTFHDSGGPEENYSNNLNQTMVIQSNMPGLNLQVEFIEFLLQNSENCVSDYLKIYNGTSTTAPLMGTWCGSDSPGTLVSDNESGALTFVFRSDNNTTATGWSANLACISTLDHPAEFRAETLGDTEIQLDWSQNTENSDVLVAWSNGLVGQPVSGAIYAAGDLLPGGGTVIYSGPLLQYNHASLQPSTTYNYRAYSYTSDYNYSSGLATSATTLELVPTLSVTPKSYGASSDAGTTRFTVTSNSSWTAQTTSDWFTVTDSGAGNGRIDVVYEENPGISPRFAPITVNVTGLNPFTVMLNQLGAAPLLEVSPLSIVVPDEVGFFDFTLISNVPWTATADSAWVDVTPSGTGSGVIKVMYDLNPYNIARQTIITITGKGLSPQEIDFGQNASSLGTNQVDKKLFKIYPNPANDAFIVEVDPAIFPEFTIQLLNAEGKEILSKKCMGLDKYTVNVSSVNSGLYMVRLVTDDKMINRVLMIAK